MLSAMKPTPERLQLRRAEPPDSAGMGGGRLLYPAKAVTCADFLAVLMPGAAAAARWQSLCLCPMPYRPTQGAPPGRPWRSSLPPPKP